MEGPSLVILREEMVRFVGKRAVERSTSIAQISPDVFKKRLVTIETWGKHLLMQFGDQTIKVHFLMFGSYRINEERDGKIPRLHLGFRNGQINFYSCSITHLSGCVEDLYDWRVDLMSPRWDPKYVTQLLTKHSSAMLCDLLLDQDLFAGAGNIIKNEVLFNLRLHPECRLEDCQSAIRRRMVKEMHSYSQKFYEWKKAFVLKRNWQVYRKQQCPHCGEDVTVQKTGDLRRVSFYCPSCQPMPAK
ncbi:DNA-formamidopyrimidine glycosylase family protein [Planctomyces sp. SH-PL14]|uniref:DNA-formamidopyrimidine glycosylase family protein n=1 Tax=Planctomyces sp. SH-PL14 TaxID=1632864 RepID=UPI00078E1019|nr:DNA-formamidopyrimidine glycosylase family protein [Planctomyces sp. SH-PL14]AMV19587.1 Formamidopyrimidine-DNA glycosylase [Planctomyces sp. SH-PL14]